jgi:hypothetical protein
MQAARLTQDYYGYIPQPTVLRKDTGPEKTGANPSRPSIFPAERVVEGEVLRKRGVSSDSLDQLLQRGRFTDGAANSPDATLTNRAAQRAVNAYLDTAATADLNGGGRPRSVDYYA